MSTAKLYAQISEETFTKQVIQMARVFGWLVMHQRPARTNKGWRTLIQGDVGFPDLVLVRGDRVIMAELKSEKGKLSPKQEKWLEWLKAAGIQAPLWRPADIDQIEGMLR